MCSTIFQVLSCISSLMKTLYILSYSTSCLQFSYIFLAFCLAKLQSKGHFQEFLYPKKCEEWFHE